MAFEKRDYVARCRKLIATHGHMFQYVMACENSGRPGYGYTLGYSLQGIPEFLVVGVGHELSLHLLREARQHWIRHPRDRNLVGVTNLPLRLQPLDVTEALEAMPLARHVLPQLPGQVVQILWPDEAGHFPGDPRYRHLITQRLDQLIQPSRKH